ncbi:hypothetical protein ANCDUO_15997 [Ancylostoma duodenale]|uniref:Uncharacterized protein n=1 Tax=Ancylostoma duodenale TaxID=51022 RepID=A0A0C2CVJ8_9BILA|nr:hypothetical protein ANCDUO_15997 [Ancylostoma duodenale]
MSYETISVRMNRSDPSIRWGFTLRQQGNRIVVATALKAFFTLLLMHQRIPQMQRCAAKAYSKSAQGQYERKRSE